MILEALGGVLGIGSKIIDKIWPDKIEAEKAKIRLLEMQQNGEFKELEERMKAIVTEASSNDPWTSRARPSFMYVMYLMILAAIPMGFLFAFKPDVAMAVTAGVKNWLQAIPEEMWWLFGAGYLGYTTSRGYEKIKGGGSGK